MDERALIEALATYQQAVQSGEYDAIRVASNDLGPVIYGTKLSRGDYEALVTEVGATLWDDGTITRNCRSYREMPEAEVGSPFWMTWALAHQRYADLKQTAPRPPLRTVATFVCSRCGGEFPRSLAMNASLGISCPDCYDDLSG